MISDLICEAHRRVGTFPNINRPTMIAVRELIHLAAVTAVPTYNHHTSKE